MNFKDIINQDVQTAEVPSPVTAILDYAERQAIRLNSVKAIKRNYHLQSTYMTKELLTAPTDRVAFFANEHIPNHFGDGQWIHYYLHVNGKRYEAVPINHHRQGVKIIKKGTYNRGDDKVVLLDEMITSVKIEIAVRTQSNLETPYVSNVKLVTGKEAAKDE